MPTVFDYDEINKIQTRQRAIPYAVYFGDMDLSEETVEELKEHANIIEYVMQFFIAMVLLGGVDELNKADLKYQLADTYRSEISSFMEVDAKVSRYIDTFADRIVENTYKNINDLWYLSDDRAKFIGENESLTLYNYTSHQQAIADGYKRKEWVAFIDNKTRETHAEINGTIIPIEDFFIVGDALMQYPKDIENAIDNPEETVNCRCKIRYLK